MSKIRSSRVSEQMKKEISDIIRTEIKDPRAGFITVTAVEATGDLQHAKVYVSVLGDEQQREASMKVLEKAGGFIRSEIGRRIRLRHTPELLFRLDTSIDYSQRINAVLRNIEHTEDADRGQS